MKYIVMLAIAVTITASVTAQTRFGVTAGATLANQRVKMGSLSSSADNHIGFTAGVVAEMPVSGSFFFRPGLNFTQKGARTKEDGETNIVRLNYLELPLDFVYKTREGFFIGAGPSVSYALSGKATFKDNTGSESEKIPFGSGEEEYKRIEFGANFLTGFQFKNGFSIAANYNMGLNSITNSPEIPFFGEVNMRNSYLGLRFAYVFPRKK